MTNHLAGLRARANYKIAVKMTAPWNTLKLLADPTRLRLVNLLFKEELSVAELQDILDMGQSRISSHLALLRKGEIAVDRKDGKRTYYSYNSNLAPNQRRLIDVACQAAANYPELKQDKSNLNRVLEKRRRQAERYFNEVAGRLGKNYLPGRSWEAIGHFLLHLTRHSRNAEGRLADARLSLL